MTVTLYKHWFGIVVFRCFYHLNVNSVFLLLPAGIQHTFNPSYYCIFDHLQKTGTTCMYICRYIYVLSILIRARSPAVDLCLMLRRLKSCFNKSVSSLLHPISSWHNNALRVLYPPPFLMPFLFRQAGRVTSHLSPFSPHSSHLSIHPGCSSLGVGPLLSLWEGVSFSGFLKGD